MLTYERVLDMLEQQESLEARIGGPDWREAEHNYGLAIYLESAEMIEHFPWKWWKSVGTEARCDQIALELVDVWHFALASGLQNCDDIPKLATALHESLEYASSKLKGTEAGEFCDLASSMGCGMLQGIGFPLGNFVALCSVCNMSFDQLYLLYCCKNVLNRFRQDRGYAKGLYAKQWNGREDNEILMEMALSMGDELDSVELYGRLDEAYRLALH